MLPALPSLRPRTTPPHAPVKVLSRVWACLRAMVLALVLLLPLGLSSCGSLPQPPRATVLSALALQIELTQQAIAAALALPPAGPPSVSHVRIEAQRQVTIGEGRGLQISGHFDWRLAEQPAVVDSPFELYLQRGERGQSWRLARPTGGDAASSTQQWLIDPLPIES